MNEIPFYWATFLLEWWASTPPNVSSQWNPAVLWPQCLLPATEKEKMRKSWQNRCYFSFSDLYFIAGLGKKRAQPVFRVPSQGFLRHVPYANCWLFSTKDNDLHLTICCLSWNSRHPLKCSRSCGSRHPWSNSIRGTHLSCRHRIPCICNNFSVIPIIIAGTDLSQ